MSYSIFAVFSVLFVCVFYLCIFVYACLQPGPKSGAKPYVLGGLGLLMVGLPVNWIVSVWVASFAGMETFMIAQAASNLILNLLRCVGIGMLVFAALRDPMPGADQDVIPAAGETAVAEDGNPYSVPSNR